MCRIEEKEPVRVRGGPRLCRTRPWSRWNWTTRINQALDVGTDSFNDADDEPFDPTEFIDEDDEF